MAVFRVEKNKNFTVMSNIHLRDKTLSLKAKGLLSLILSLPDDWQYSIRGLAAISKESDEGIASGLKELEKAGYLVRHQLRGNNGRLGQIEYVIYESPCTNSPCAEKPVSGIPDTVVPNTVFPYPGETAQQNTKKQIQEKQKKDSSNNLIISNPITPEHTAEEMREDRIRLKNILYISKRFHLALSLCRRRSVAILRQCIHLKTLSPSFAMKKANSKVFL